MLNLSTLIGSCDKYTPLLKAFQICFNKYWQVDTHNVIVTETIDIPNYTSTNFEVVKSEGEWGSRMLEGISKIKTDFVFFILDDYMLNYTYPSSTIENYIKFAEKYNVDRIQVSPSSFQSYSNNIIEGFTKFSQLSYYKISMQPSIWSKSFLLDTLEPSYSPWDFEIKGSTRLVGQTSNIFIDTSIPSPYFNAVRKGMVKSPGWDDFFKQENIEVPII